MSPCTAPREICLTLDLVVATQILMQLAVRDIGQVTDIQGLAGPPKPSDPGVQDPGGHRRFCQHWRTCPFLALQTLRSLPSRKELELRRPNGLAPAGSLTAWRPTGHGLASFQGLNGLASDCVTAWWCAVAGSLRRCGTPCRRVVPGAYRSVRPAGRTPLLPDREGSARPRRGPRGTGMDHPGR